MTAPLLCSPSAHSGSPLPVAVAVLVMPAGTWTPVCAECLDDATDCPVEERPLVAHLAPLHLDDCGEDCDTPTLEMLADEGCSCVREALRILN